jgi:hypothetical protein
MRYAAAALASERSELRDELALDLLMEAAIEAMQRPNWLELDTVSNFFSRHLAFGLATADRGTTGSR